MNGVFVSNSGFLRLLAVFGFLAAAFLPATTMASSTSSTTSESQLADSEVELVDGEAAENQGPGEDWPIELFNGDLPMGGIFYGNSLSGRGTANGPVSFESSRRFRAERSGEIVSYTYHNRLLRNSEINTRCNSSGPESVWCKCKNSGLGQNMCGYTLPNSYHVGNGGTIVVELRPDDGTGKPADTVLGHSVVFVPAENRDKWFATLRFAAPGKVEAGQIYHMVHTNLTPPTKCRINNVPVQKAASCSVNEGAQGLNGSFYTSKSTTTGRWGPFRGELGAATLYRRHKNSEWTLYEHSVSFYEVEYADGVSVGDSYYSYDALPTKQVIGGNTSARQVFTVKDVSREVDGLWLSHGHTTRADGSALKVELKDDTGVVLASGTLAASQHCLDTVKSNNTFPGRDCRDWNYTELSNAVTLLEGHRYSLEMTAGANSGFVFSTYQPLSSFGFKDRNQWNGARAEISKNGGARWDRWADRDSGERDMALLFTIVGMPRQLY